MFNSDIGAEPLHLIHRGDVYRHLKLMSVDTGFQQEGDMVGKRGQSLWQSKM